MKNLTEMPTVYGDLSAIFDSDETLPGTLCGKLIRIGNDTTGRLYTIGGLVRVEVDDSSSSFYGITAGHGVCVGTANASSFNDAVSSDGDSDDAEDSEVDSNNPIDSYLSHTTSIGNSEDIEQANPSTVSQPPAELKDELGKVVAVSRDADWAIFTVDVMSHEPNHGLGKSEDFVGVRDVKRHSPRQAIVYGGFSGTVYGTVSSSSFCMLPGSRNLVEVFDLALASDQGRSSSYISFHSANFTA